ncbi:MarR family winged helix-turn-helix transcriptional regulator [Geobacter grbiciae]|uniref:MarR family winged helix-turn-helix transcriptional regulator n=1 Tax=Geobacter grbiciae TaxID=155042 RepID=UPI001C02EFFB|nr:MarR family transcriptional regulator [Geobacter grbiciae]MBT1076494.1 MarR family transcriptional regulator [Geobacter grbiciae]
MISYRDHIVFLIAKAHQRAQGALKGHLLPFGLTPMQCLFLEALMEEDGLSVGEIGRRIALDTATLAGILDRMVTAGWVRRETDSQDARVARVYLTGKATAAIPELSASIERTNDELMRNFSLEEKLLMKRFLRDFRE